MRNATREDAFAWQTEGGKEELLSELPIEERSSLEERRCGQ